jgi:hypothetical protein
VTATTGWLYPVPPYADRDDGKLRNPNAPPVTGAFTLDVLPATVAITGQSISLVASRNLAVNPATVAIAGQSISLVLTRKISVNPATVTIVGQSVALAVGRKIAVSPATVPIAGQVIALAVGRKLNVTPATVAIAGQNVDLVYTPVAGAFTLDVLPATVAITGQSVALVYTPAIAASNFAHWKSWRPRWKYLDTEAKWRAFLRDGLPETIPVPTYMPETIEPGGPVRVLPPMLEDGPYLDRAGITQRLAEAVIRADELRRNQAAAAHRRQVETVIAEIEAELAADAEDEAEIEMLLMAA